MLCVYFRLKNDSLVRKNADWSGTSDDDGMNHEQKHKHEADEGIMTIEERLRQIDLKIDRVCQR